MIELHTMKIIPSYYRLLKEGKKKVEFRLFDEKRSLIHVGDRIKFVCKDDPNETLYFTVLNLMRSRNFTELLENIPTSLLGVTKENQLADLKQIYEGDMQARYGVLAIFLSEGNESSPGSNKY